MADIIELDEHRPHECFEAICLHCKFRWLAVCPVDVVPMKDWECDECGKMGGIIRTGQPLDFERKDFKMSTVKDLDDWKDPPTQPTPVENPVPNPQTDSGS